MQRKNGNNKVIPNLIWNLQRKVVSQRQQQRQAWKTLNQVQGDDLVCYNYNNGFTLIELLVVVLIIGILAAVALPQYQKAVWKSRNMQLKTIIKSVGTAVQTYYMTNGYYPATFDELDVDLPLSGPRGESTSSVELRNNVCRLSNFGGDAVRTADHFQVVMNTTNKKNSLDITAVWTDGPYRCAGFFLRMSTYELYCTEASWSAGRNKFCSKLENLTESSYSESWYKYPIL